VRLLFYALFAMAIAFTAAWFLADDLPHFIRIVLGMCVAIVISIVIDAYLEYRRLWQRTRRRPHNGPSDHH
jgi:uncharacterized membrane protein